MVLCQVQTCLLGKLQAPPLSRLRWLSTLDCQPECGKLREARQKPKLIDYWGKWVVKVMYFDYLRIQGKPGYSRTKDCFVGTVVVAVAAEERKRGKLVALAVLEAR